MMNILSVDIVTVFKCYYKVRLLHLSWISSLYSLLFKKSSMLEFLNYLV